MEHPVFSILRWARMQCTEKAQGKTSSQARWVIDTISLLCALGKFNPGVTVACVEGIPEVKRLADALFDDKDMWTSSRVTEHHADEMIDMMSDFFARPRLGNACFLPWVDSLPCLNFIGGLSEGTGKRARQSSQQRKTPPRTFT